MKARAPQYTGTSGTRQLTSMLRNPLHAIILINVAVTVSLYCASAIFQGTSHGGGSAPSVVNYLVLPGQFTRLVYRPWTLLTYMFTQVDIIQLICNMLWLWMFGHMYEMARGSRRASTLWWLYIGGGIGGAMAFIACCHFCHLPYPPVLLGASGATLAVICATAMRLPDFRVNLIIFGMVRLKWIATAAILYFIVASAAQNLPSAAAHAGGALAGIGYALWMKHSSGARLMPRRKRALRDDDDGQVDEAELDLLLKKVSASGYSSLSPRERQRLIKFSKGNKHQ